MAAPTAGSFLLVANYQTLQDQISALEAVGTNSASSFVSTLGTTTSTSYTTTLTGSTVPAVTVTLASTLQACLIGIFAGTSNNTNNDGVFITYSVSGAATVAASDGNGAHNTNVAADRNNGFTVGRVRYYAPAVTGSITVTMNVRAITGGTASTQNRELWVVLLPYNS